MQYKLRPYQSGACRSIMAEFEQGTKRTLLILPTGGGKTIVLSGIAYKFAYDRNRNPTGEFEQGTKRTLLILPTGGGKTIVLSGIAYKFAYDRNRNPTGGRVLILAHQNILIDQAADKFQTVMELPVFREQGKRTGCLEPVTVSSMQTMQRRLDRFPPDFFRLIIIDEAHHAMSAREQGKRTGCLEPVTVSSMQTMQRRLDRFPPDFFRLIIIDEAHHAMSAGYQRILEHFTDARVLGVTATPDRADGKKLSCFDSVAFEYTIKQAINDGYLVPLKVKRAPLTINLSKVRKRRGDMDASDLGSVIEPYLHQIAEIVRSMAKGRRIVCFVPLIRTTKRITPCQPVTSGSLNISLMPGCWE